MTKAAQRTWKPTDVAVIGLACRFPGSASDESKLWELLAERKSAHSRVPKERYNVDAFYQQGTTHPNNLAADGAHFLEQDVSSFDAPFFSITAEEAKAMDPQARLLLECSYDALENAGLSVESIADTDTGCYVGCFNRDYHELLMSDAEDSPKYSGTGTGFSLLSNRLSWYYNLKGPSVSEDTACSSSLVALDLAYKSLLRGESKMAMVCGANLMLSPNIGLWLSKLNMLSSEGTSRSFAEGVDGYGRGEGIATVILKPLADAIRDGDTVRAVVRGTGVNQDGHTKGITVPNSQAQSELIEMTYKEAGLDFAETGYFEAHGTGTAIGDPLELGAVSRVAKNSNRTSPLYVGSIKSNIGHLEGAAGLAGLIKCILMLEKDVILPNIHFERPNKRISFEQIVVPTAAVPWPRGLKRRASVNSFGYGGTNAHAIVEAFFTPTQESRDEDLRSALEDGLMTPSARRLFVFSGHESSTAQEMRAQYAAYAQGMEHLTSPNAKFDDLSYTLGSRRSKLGWAVAHVASDFKELREKLSATEVKATHTSSKPRVGFVFTGQGAQWPRMGRELMSYATFRDSVQAADEYLTQTLDCRWSVMEELEKDEAESRIISSELGQPLCTIIQVAMVDLLRSWHVLPTAVVGHSSGEIAAAYCVGAISQQAAWHIACQRGRECAQLKVQAPELRGAMLAVGLSAEVVKPYINALSPDRIKVACINSPNSITVSGDAPEISKLLEVLTADSIFARELPVENAYHSHHMELVAKSYLHSLKSLDGQGKDVSPGAKMLSSVTGKPIEPSELTAEYWVRNLVSPVLFADAVATMLRGSKRSFRRSTKAEPAVDFLLELGPHATLQTPLLDIVKSEALEGVKYASMLRRGKDAIDSAITAAGSLFCHGCPVDIAAVNNLTHECRVLVDLPAYPWNRSNKYWGVSRLVQDYLHRPFPHHGLLGARLIGSDEMHPAWRHFLNFQENPWIKGHVVHGATLYPGAGFLAMAIEGALQCGKPSRKVANVRLEDVRIVKALVMKEEDDAPEVITRLRRTGIVHNGELPARWVFDISSAKGRGGLEQHATGQVILDYLPQNPFLSPASDFVREARRGEYAKLADNCVDTMTQGEFYDASKDAGLAYGPDFQGIAALASGTDSCCWSIQVTDRALSLSNGFESKHLIHPTTLDAIVHSLFAAMNKGKEFQTAALPVAFDSIMISTKMPADAGSKMSGFTVVRKVEEREIIADIHVSSSDWTQPLIEIQGLRCTEMPSQKAELALSKARPSPKGTIVHRPDIDLFDEEGFISWLKENQKRGSPNGGERALYSEGLRTAVAQVVELAVFKNPTLSILQIGGFDHGLTDSLLSTLKAGMNGQALTSEIVIVDFAVETVTQIRDKYDVEPWIVDALHVDDARSLSSTVEREGGFDILLVTIDHGLTDENKQSLMKEARIMLKRDGVLVVFDTLREIREKPQGADDHSSPSFYGFNSVTVPSPSHIRTWESFTIKDAACEHAAVVSTTRQPVRMSHPVCILRPSGCTEKIKDVVDMFKESLCAHDMDVSVRMWPPSVEDVKSKFVISLLDLDGAFLCNLDASDFDVLRQIARQSARLLWTSPGDDPHMAVATGWLRVLQSENVTRQYQHLSLQGATDRSPPDLALAIAKVAMVQSDESEFVEQDGWFSIPRWSYDSQMTRAVADSTLSLDFANAPLEEVNPGTRLRMAHSGDLKNAHFVPDELQTSILAADKVEVELKFASITQQDLDDPGKRTLREASGVITAVGSDVSRLRPGDNVCLSFFGRLSTSVVIEEVHCQKVPPGVEMNQAACLPITFATALRALVDVAGVKPQQKVLVQAGGTKVGRAVVLLASASDAIVYATARSSEEVESLVSLGIAKSNILTEGDPLLPTVTKILTNDRGWDTIIRTARTLHETCLLPKCVAPFGAIVDVFPMGNPDSMRETTISVMGIGPLLPEDPVLMQKAMSSLKEYLPQLSLLAQSFDTFPSGEVVEALECHQKQGAYRGVILSISREDTVRMSPSVKNSVRLRGDATYVLAGGLGGIGRSLARLMVDNGARNLVFLSRSGPDSFAARVLADDLGRLGVTVKTIACDITDEESVAAALGECARVMPPIRGAVQAAAVIRDAIFDNYTFEQWQANLGPKVQGSWNLHCQLPENMDFFIMLSSIVGLVGHQSQAGYAAGNTFQDALALHRRTQGLPAVTIDLGAMLDVGTIMEGATAADFSSDAAWMTARDLHNIMTMCMSGDIDGHLIPAQVCTGLPSGGMLQHGNPFYMERPMFAALKRLGTSATSTADAQTSGDVWMEFIDQLTAVRSVDDAQCHIAEILRSHLAEAVGRAVDDIDVSQPLHRYGVDSLMAVKLRGWIGEKLKADVDIFDILQAERITELALQIAETSELVPEEIREAE